jgi:hypothetical protein
MYIAIAILLIYALVTYGARTADDDTEGYPTYTPPDDEGSGPAHARRIART